MFKKPQDVAERGRTLLSKKDMKKLRASIMDQLAVTEDKISEVLHNKSNIEMTKLANRSVMYYVDGIPLFIDEGGRNKIFPTLQYLWKYPDTLRCFIIHSQVSKFVLNGADLMLPGVAVTDNLHTISIGEIVAVRVFGNPLPFAVGRSACSWEGILANNKRGKGMDSLTVFGDLLSTIGMDTSKKNCIGPNAGFILNNKYILPLEGYVDALELVIPEADEEEENGTIGGDEDEDGEKETSDHNDGEKEASSDQEEEDVATLKEEMSQLNTKTHRQRGKKSELNVTVRLELSEEEKDGIDALFRISLVLLLKYFIKAKHIPLLLNICWPLLLKIMKHVKDSGNEGVLIDANGGDQNGTLLGSFDSIPDLRSLEVEMDIKRSHYRSVSNFLSQMSRADSNGDQMMTITDKDGVVTITDVCRTHNYFRQVRHANPDALKAAISALDQDENGGGGIAKSDLLMSMVNNQDNSKGKKGGQSVIVKEVFKIPKNIREVLYPGVSHQGEIPDYLILSELKELLVSHFKQYGLDSKSNKQCIEIPVENHLYKIAKSIDKSLPEQERMSGSSGNDGARQNMSQNQGNKHGINNSHSQMATTVDEYDEGEEEEALGYIQEQAVGGKLVAGVWIPDSGTHGRGGTGSHTAANDAPKSVFKAVSLPSKEQRLAALASKSTKVSDEEKRAVRRKEKELKREAAALEALEEEVPILIRKDVFMKGIVKKMTRCHYIQPSSDARPIINSGPPPNIDIQVVCVRGNKNMTHIIGKASFPFQQHSHSSFTFIIMIIVVSSSLRFSVSTN